MTTEHTVDEIIAMNRRQEERMGGANRPNGASTERNLDPGGVSPLSSNRPDFDRAGGAQRDSSHSTHNPTAFERLLSTGLKSPHDGRKPWVEPTVIPLIRPLSGARGDRIVIDDPWSILLDDSPDDWAKAYPTQIAEIADMAALGRSFMEAVDDATKPGAMLRGWTPADSPVEIVFDLINLLSDKDVEIEGLKGDVRQAEAAYEGRDMSARQACELLRDEIAEHEATITQLKADKIALSQPRIFHAVGMIEQDLAERFESMRANYQTMYARCATAEGLIKESLGPVRLVNELATLTDVECEFLDGFGLRETARSGLDGDFTLPRLYGEEDRKRAADALAFDRPGCDVERCLELVDRVAQALGMRRAGE